MKNIYKNIINMYKKRRKLCRILDNYTQRIYNPKFDSQKSGNGITEPKSGLFLM